MARNAAERMAAYRARRMARGFKTVQLWVPDLDGLEFQARLRCTAALPRDHPSTREVDEIRDAMGAELFADYDRLEAGELEGP